MFYNSYQSGLFLELFDPKNNEKKNQNLIKQIGQQNIKKLYDNKAKSYILDIGSNHGSRIQFPKDDKSDLGATQPFLCLQIFIPQDSMNSIELVIQDMQKVKRRIYICSECFHQEIKFFSVKFPNNIIARDRWVNLIIDIHSLVQVFKIEGYKSLCQISVQGKCKIRKIFTTKFPVQTQIAEDYTKYEQISKNLNFLPSTDYSNQIYNMNALNYEVPSQRGEQISEISKNSIEFNIKIPRSDQKSKKKLNQRQLSINKSNEKQNSMNRNTILQQKEINFPSLKDRSKDSQDMSQLDSQLDISSNLMITGKNQAQKTIQQNHSNNQNLQQKNAQNLKNTLHQMKYKETNKVNPWRKNPHKYVTKEAQKYFENKQKIEEQKQNDLLEVTQKFNTLNLKEAMEQSKISYQPSDISDEIEDEISANSTSQRAQEVDSKFQNCDYDEIQQIDDFIEKDDLIDKLEIGEQIEQSDSYDEKVENYIKKNIRPYSPPFQKQVTQYTQNSMSNEFLNQSLKNKWSNQIVTRNLFFDQVEEK